MGLLSYIYFENSSFYYQYKSNRQDRYGASIVQTIRRSAIPDEGRAYSEALTFNLFSFSLPSFHTP